MAISDADMRDLRKELVDAIKTETNEAIKHTGHSWIEEAVRKIVPIAVEATLVRLGMQCDSPFDMQRDFAFLRQSRLDSEDRRKVFWKTVVSWGTTIVIAAVVAYAAANKA